MKLPVAALFLFSSCTAFQQPNAAISSSRRTGSIQAVAFDPMAFVAPKKKKSEEPEEPKSDMMKGIALSVSYAIGNIGETSF